MGYVLQMVFARVLNWDLQEFWKKSIPYIVHSWTGFYVYLFLWYWGLNSGP
jgi:hypothetical protein